MQERIRILALPREAGKLSATVSICLDLLFTGPSSGNGNALISATKFHQWPNVARRGRFTISVNGTSIDVTPDFSQLDTVLWSSLFDSLRIKSRPENHPQLLAAGTISEHSSYSVSQAETSVLRFHEHVLTYTLRARAHLSTEKNNARRIHQAMRFASHADPNFTDYPDMEWFFDEGSDERQTLVRDLLAANKTPLTSPQRFRGDVNDTENFQDLLRFHKRTAEEQEAIAKSAKTISKFDPPEFHERLVAMGEFPTIMRSLGLIFDVKLPAGIFPKGQFDLSADITGLEITPEACVTKTYASLSENELYVISRLPAPSTPAEDLSKSADFSGGKLNLGQGEKFPIVQIDAAGSVLKLNYFVENLARMRESYTADGSVTEVPRSAAPPSIRTTGISLTRSGQAREVVEARIMRNTALAAFTGGPREVYAEDVIRGYAIDVSFREETGQWSNWYSLCLRDVDPGIPGVLKQKHQDEGWINGITSSKEPGVNRVFVSESLTTWDGWSLVAPRPVSPTADCRESPVKKPRSFEGVFLPVITPRKGSLPRLRYGRTYRLRARIIDLAGNDMSVSHGSKDDPTTISSEVIYHRFEPVTSPVFTLVKDLGDNSPGETLDHMVVRSLDTAPPQISQRNVFPPKASIDMAIQHGALDTLSREQSYDLLAQQDRELLGVYAGKLVPVPYLPDPMAIGVTLESDRIESIRFQGDWPYRKSIRINLKGGPVYRVNSNEAAGEVTIELPPSEMTVIKVSSVTSEENFQKLGHWHQMQKVLPLVASSETAGGTHWMLTPYRLLFLIHAVQQPIEAPTFIIERDRPESINLTPKERKFGDTFVDLQGSIKIHSKSTGKFELVGSWKDAEDDLDKPGPGISELRQSQFYEQSVNYDDPDQHDFGVTPETNARQIFNDTKYREVTYHGVGTTRFLDQLFTHEQRANQQYVVTKETSEQEKLFLRRVIPSTARPAACTGLYALPLFGWLDRSLGKTGGRKFVSRKRVGGGLRIYMDRGWYSSGAGEMLGIVLWPDTGGEVPAELQSLTSGIGSDPLWKAKGVSSRLRPEHFLNREHVLSGQNIDDQTYTLHEINLKEPIPYPANLRVKVAAFTPRYHQVRQLWYCDIEVDAGNLYFPFIRLALARYQPNSISRNTWDCHLSKVILADFIQLAPDRLASITFDPHNKKSITITVSGPAPQSSAAFPETNTVEARVEKRDKTRESGWVPTSESIVLTPRADDALTIWSGNAMLTKSDRDKFRVVIQEYERFRSDSSNSEKRLVYADVIELAD